MSGSIGISHDGQVIEIAQGEYVVKISAQPACASCGAKSLCSTTGTTGKHIRAVPYEALQLGDHVQVIMEERLGWKAIFYSFVLPFLVMMLALCAAYAAGSGDTSAALSAVGSLVPYYFLLYLFKKKIEEYHSLYSIAKKIS